MTLNKLKSSDQPDRVREALSEAGPVVVRLEADGRTGLVVSDGPHAKAGQKLALVGAKGVKGDPLDAVLAGRPATGEQKAVSRTGPGEVIIFEQAYAQGGDLVCGAIATRMHDDMDRPVQAMRMLARPSRYKVSEHGVFQFLTMVDPGMATRVASAEDLAALLAAMAAKPWPGGTRGLILRNAHKPLREMTDEERREAAEVMMEQGESDKAYVARLVQTNEVLSKGALEAIPAWSVPMSRAQIFREGGAMKEPGPARTGNFSKLYLSQTGRPWLGFLPSFVILTDEEEWAFKAKTGKHVRACAGLHPLRLGNPVQPSHIATALRNDKQKPKPVIQALSLYRDEAQVAEAMRQRAARRPKPEPARVAAPAATAAPGGRPAVPPPPLRRAPPPPPRTVPGPK